MTGYARVPLCRFARIPLDTQRHRCPPLRDRVLKQRFDFNYFSPGFDTPSKAGIQEDSVMTFAIIALPIKIPAPDKQTVGTWPIVIVGSNKMLLAIAIEAEENREPTSHERRSVSDMRHAAWKWQPSLRKTESKGEFLSAARALGSNLAMELSIPRGLLCSRSWSARRSIGRRRVRRKRNRNATMNSKTRGGRCTTGEFRCC